MDYPRKLLLPLTKVVNDEGKLLVQPRAVETRLPNPAVLVKLAVKLEIGLNEPTLLTLATIKFTLLMFDTTFKYINGGTTVQSVQEDVVMLN